MTVSVAITRRVRPGLEAQFEEELRQFLQTSFAHGGVLGASLLITPAGSGSREFGILRTFRDEKERDAFYASPLFAAWDERARDMTEDEPEYRALDGMEAWFREPGRPPPRWKMALLTWLAVWPVSFIVPAALFPLLGTHLPGFLFAGCVAAGIVVILTWGAMPLLVRLARPWLQAVPRPREAPDNKFPTTS
ncbi:antibiotic biosynthesis monooxygenase [Azoarcus sp. L1K30]|uniref:antibiotic biosynthesis monooxygenase n=1 Tax=Azoarcus sp. L1K30 TaxID=2820277 RepID=UPI001B827E78|nr:antibiotic biosynthesis monooxygenase [Azoarcus sp. L1K30]MBR0566047.1 antibiotic biosynthesis monooxygenase [Azoarcus sp. L1K30]